MRKIALTIASITLASTGAYAQQAADPATPPGDAAVASLPAPPSPTEAAPPADAAADAAADVTADVPADTPALPDTSAEADATVTAEAEAEADAPVTAEAAPPPTPAEPAAPVTADAAPAATSVTDAEVESFAAATVKVQSINTDTTIAADQKQTQMAAAVQEAGIAPQRYNEIGQALSTDTALRARVQTAMAKHATPSDG